MEMYFKEGKTIISIDECGRGSFSGPMIACAIILPNNFELKGVNDSKKLSKEKRNVLSEEILKKCIAFGIGEISVEEIDKHNLNDLNKLCFVRALNNLKFVENNSPFTDFENSFIIIDGNLKPIFNCGIETIVKGDAKYTQIAAASIVGKVYRDNLMTELGKKYSNYGWDDNAGYGTAKHIKAIKDYGICEHHRTSFLKNYQ
jgi:ribonuclease HII